MVEKIETIGAFAGLAAFLGLGVFALLSFSQARDLRRLRDWAGSAPEREEARKEQTSAIAAQRAEELRALEESRTAEHEAVADREERRRRREEGLPEGSTGERVRGALSGAGDRLGEPRWLAAVFVVLVLIAGGVAYAILSGGGDDEGGGNGQGAKQASAKTSSPSEIKVSVLNGTATEGLAGTYGERVEKKGFSLGAVTNSSESFEQSVVMYTRGHRGEAKKVSKQLGIPDLELMTEEIESVAGGADVAVVVGEDDAAAAS